MVSRICVGVICLMVAIQLVAQEDTVRLEAVQVDGDFYLASQVSQLDSVGTVINRGQSLGELLQASSGLYLRRYGAEGQLTSVSFRGTTPSQTQVAWKGLDINSQTLGQSDFSSIPSFLFESINLHHGAASTLYGSGAVGGVVELNTGTSSPGVHAEVLQQLGSFGKVFTGAKGAYNTSLWGVNISALRTRVDNDFDVDFRGDTYQQNNAASELNAIIGESWIRLGNGKLTGSVWYNEHDRESQPIIGFFNASDQLLDKNLRANLSYEAAMPSGYLEASVSYIDDRQTYNEGSQTNLKRYLAKGEYQFLQFDPWDIRLGTNLTYAVPDVSSYEDDISQVRADGFLLSKFEVSDRVNLSANFRLPYQQNQEEIPFVPALGVQWSVLGKGNTALQAQLRVARSYRFPTFNDYYWQPGGNKDLVPEDGQTIENSWRLDLQQHALSLKSKISAYYTNMSEMIVWVPLGDYWSPQNVNSVHITGLETDLSLSYNLSVFKFLLSGVYAYSRSENQETNTQLAYVPFHKGSFTANVSSEKWSLTYLESYTGKRYTESTNTSSLDAFKLAQAHLDYRFLWSEHAVGVGVQVKNLWDVDYQNYELRATPGRHYLIQLNYQLTKSL